MVQIPFGPWNCFLEMLTKVAHKPDVFSDVDMLYWAAPQRWQFMVVLIGGASGSYLQHENESLQAQPGPHCAIKGPDCAFRPPVRQSQKDTFRYLHISIPLAKAAKTDRAVTIHQ